LSESIPTISASFEEHFPQQLPRQNYDQASHAVRLKKSCRINRAAIRIAFFCATNEYPRLAMVNALPKKSV